MVEISTAGTTILMEFQKYPLMPAQVRPTQVSPQALAQGARVGCSGSASMLPSWISPMVLKEVTSMTKRGMR